MLGKSLHGDNFFMKHFNKSLPKLVPIHLLVKLWIIKRKIRRFPFFFKMIRTTKLVRCFLIIKSIKFASTRIIISHKYVLPAHENQTEKRMKKKNQYIQQPRCAGIGTCVGISLKHEFRRRLLYRMFVHTESKKKTKINWLFLLRFFTRSFWQRLSQLVNRIKFRSNLENRIVRLLRC